jgi:hypothetical protein
MCKPTAISRADAYVLATDYPRAYDFVAGGLVALTWPMPIFIHPDGHIIGPWAYCAHNRVLLDDCPKCELAEVNL